MPSFDSALDETADEQVAYREALGFLEERTPFAAESLPNSDIQVDVNEDLLHELASHILNQAGHATVIDEAGAGKSLLRDDIYAALRDRDEQFRVVRIKEVEQITTRRFYVRVLDGLRAHDDLEIPAEEALPRSTDGVRSVVEEIAEQLEASGLTCIVQVDQMEDVVMNTRRFEQLLAGLQSVGDLGEEEPVFILFLFGTPIVSERIEDLRETLDTRLVAKNRSLERFGYSETDELIGRWLAWARGEEFSASLSSAPFTGEAIQAIVDASDGTPRNVRQECYHAWRAGARQHADTGESAITRQTIEEYR
jgi:type II secretory pathway predicted ATPase ExeA